METEPLEEVEQGGKRQNWTSVIVRDHVNTKKTQNIEKNILHYIRL